MGGTGYCLKLALKAKAGCPILLPLENAVRESGREAQRELTSRLLKECKATLSILEGSPTIGDLGPAECFRLFYRLGWLEFGDWRTLNDAESGLVRTGFSELELRLRTILTSRKGDQLLRCVQSGMAVRLAEIQRDRLRIEGLLAEDRLEKTLPSIELNAILLTGRDYLAYALLLFEKLGVTPNSEVSSLIMALDDDMKMLLPRIIGLYRGIDDDPTPYPGHFPKSFWWRHL
jgi:hypothetical protein